MTDELNRPLPACGSVDFGNVAEVVDCGHLLLARLQLGDDAAAADALLWVGKVEASMPCYAAGDALHLLELYDLLHRYACGSAPDRRLLDACCLRALDALMGGDSGGDECELFSAVSQGVNVRHDVACLGRPMMWYLATRERWVDGELENSTVVDVTTTVEPTDHVVKTYGVGAPVSPLTGADGTTNAPASYSKVLTGKATGYYSKTGKGSSGLGLGYGTVAVDPDVIPYGTLLYITSTDGRFVYGYAIATDTGIAVQKGEILVDLFYETYAESVINGAIQVNVYVVN